MDPFALALEIFTHFSSDVFASVLPMTLVIPLSIITVLPQSLYYAETFTLHDLAS